MINLKRTFSYFATIVFAIALYSCGGTSKKDAEDTNAFDEAESQILQDIDKVVHELPPPSEVPYLLQATGTDFNPDLLNSLDNASKYETSNDKAAMNLGAYSTAIGYLSSYDKAQDALKYMETCQKLADVIGISSAFDLDLMERFEKNLGNRDSLSNLIDLAITTAEQKLETVDRLNVVALILSGSYIEGLFLSIMVIDTYPDDLLPEHSRNLILEPLVKIVLEQHKPLIDVIALLKDLESDEEIANVIAELNILRILYEDELLEIDDQIANNKGDFILSKDMLGSITTEIKRIRAEMIK